MNPHAKYKADGHIEMVNIDTDFNQELSTTVGTVTNLSPLTVVDVNDVKRRVDVGLIHMEEGDKVDITVGLSQVTIDGNYCQVNRIIPASEYNRRKWFADRDWEVTKDMKVQVSVYSVTRHYGGPAEGGWYYNWNNFTGVSERVPWWNTEAVQKSLMDLYKDDQPKYDIYSEANDGPQYETFVELCAGENQTKQRPHYE